MTTRDAQVAEPARIDAPNVAEMLADASVGSKSHYRIAAARTPSGTTVDVPITVIRGTRPGPVFVLLSGVHGDEGVAPQAVARYCASLDPASLRGTILALPVANPPAFDQRTRLNPWDGGDLVRVWPGDPAGSMSQQIAFTLFSAVISRADYLVDVHSGTSVLYESWVLYANSRGPMPDVSGQVERQSRQMAVAFGLDQIIRGHPWMTTVSAGGQAGIPTIIAEIGGSSDAYHHVAAQREKITTGINNVLVAVGMVDGEIDTGDVTRVSEFDIAEEFITACPIGLWERHANPGDEVEAGSVIGAFSDVATGEEVGRVRATRSARILNPVVSWPQVGPGQWLMASGTLVAELDPRTGESAGV